MAGIPKKQSINPGKENLQEVSLQKKKQCFNKARKIVECLLEEDVDESQLLQNLKYITQSDYQDVVEERSIVKLCGYAVCKNKLENVPTKKYHISTASNKVYDITERKNFCSNWCYKASLYLKEQVLTSPVWLRDDEGIPAFHMLPRSHKGGCAGDEVNLKLTTVTPDEPKPAAETACVDNLTSFAMSTLEELQQIGGPCYNNLLIVEKTSTTSTKESESNINSSTTQSDNQFSREVIFEAEISKTNSQNDISSQTLKCESIENIEQSLQLICTIESGNDTSNTIIPKIEEDTKISGEGLTTDETTISVATKIDRTFTLASDVKLSEKQKMNAPNVTHLPKINYASNTIIPKIEEDTEISGEGLTTDETTISVATKIDRTFTLASDVKLSEKQKMNAPNVTHLPKINYSSHTIIPKFEEDTEIQGEGLTTDETTISVATKIDRTFTLTTDVKSLEKQKMNAPNISHLSKATTISNKKTQLNPTTSLPVIKTMPINKEKQKFNVSRLETVAHEWFTLESAIYLFGIDNIITKLTLQAERFEAESHSTDETQIVENQFFKLCKELEDKKLMSEIKNENQKKQLSMLELKVRAFYEGKTRIEPTEPKVEEKSIIMPVCHRYDQKTIRQKIVLTKLAHVFPELLEIFGVNAQNIITEAQKLTETFNLGAHNIALRPMEWNLMGLLLIKMISEKDPELKVSLSSKKSTKRLTMMMKSFELKPTFLDKLISQLCGVDNIVLQNIAN